MIIPNKLIEGDTIGIIAPSDPIVASKLEDINNSILLLEKAGFKIKFAKNVFNNELGYSAEAIKKSEDINEMFKNPEIKAIMCCTGGENSNSLFEYIDYELIKNNPKIICGFSDSTSILSIINEKTGLVTFNGPTFKSLTSWETDYAYKEFVKRFVKEELELGTVEDEYLTIKEGEAKGKLIGGNLGLISDLCCGKYNVNFEDKILFIEELGIESGPARVSHFLYKLKQNDVFKKIKGLWIGYYECESKINIEQIVLDTIGDEYNFPIIKSNNFGHCDKKTVVPIGIMAKIDTNETRKITLLENCVK